MRHGQPRTAGDTTAGAETLYRALAPLLGELFEPAAGRAARLLASTGPRILDVGAGAAPWSRALAAQDPRRHVTALDLPQVLDAARTAVEADGLGDQFDFVAADMFSGDWPGEYDLVLAANVCHLFDEESNLVLAGRLFSALRPGGTLAVVDILPDESLDGPPAAVLYGLGLLLRTATGRAYPFSAYTKWLEAVGLQAIERRDLSTSPPFTLITSRKPLG